ncbi:MAG: Gfo/Idh/MocA family oxidoreductase [Ignavibacteriaceae bacterium]|nr:Gfo/Idh/MocA family oxidoreductase [Ignavibacteriaceae bacterium]
MKVGVVGLGYWGPNIIRNFLSCNEVEKVIGCDKRVDRLSFVKNKFPEIEITDDYQALLNADIDSIAVATPVRTHYWFARRALEAGKHIWVEKPFTSSSQQAQELIEIADKNNLKIFVDHTFIYTGAVRKIKELVDKGELGEIIYFDSVRINLGLFQHDCNVVWDLAPHDLSIMNFILPNKKIEAVTACGVSNYYDQENLAQLSLHFEKSNCFAHFHVNWTSPVKIRRIMIAGKKRMLVYDDMENSEKIKVYDCRVEMNSIEDIHSALAQYRIGDMHSPKIEQYEALAACVNEFISAIKEDRQPLTGAEEGLEVVRILEATDKSIKNKGAYVELMKVIKSDEYSKKMGEYQKFNMNKNKDTNINSTEFEKAVGF